VGKNIQLEMRWKRAWVATECNGAMVWGMELYWMFVGGVLWEDYSR